MCNRRHEPREAPTVLWGTPCIPSMGRKSDRGSMPTATAPPPPPSPPTPVDADVPPGDPPGRGPGERPDPKGDPSRTGTLWVGATGVSLLLAAAAVLTAVRWGDIGQTAKLGGFVAITLAMLFGGQRLQRTIPLTGRAIFHLGALLIPLDMAAVAVLAERTWQETLLLTSVTAVAAWYALLRVDPSPVLAWAARGSVVLAAAGLAAVTPISMPLALVGAAALATALTIGDGAGITAIALLGESHMSVHTWPERQFAAFDLFTCNLDVNADNVIDIIKNAYPAKSLTVSRILRGENTRSTTL